tara:strand:+ start:1215 stop:1562 length:348 start_codon:yes stop_codon:yes gene_type:complete
MLNIKRETDMRNTDASINLKDIILAAIKAELPEAFANDFCDRDDTYLDCEVMCFAKNGREGRKVLASMKRAMKKLQAQYRFWNVQIWTPRQNYGDDVNYKRHPYSLDFQVYYPGA